jgi:serine/threonine protein phosphatase PrpC
MLCPSCHTPNRDNAKFCKGCGQLLVVEVVAAGQETQLAETQPGAMPPSQTEPSDACGNAEPASMSQQQTRSVPIQPAQDWGNECASECISECVSKSTLNPNDPSLAPTEILTPEQMTEAKARRWQRNFEVGPKEQELQNHNHASEKANNAEVSNASDIANAPTIITAASSPTPAANTPQPQQDIADMATIIMSPKNAPTVYDGMSQSVSSRGISGIEEEEGPMTKEHSETTEAPSGEEPGSINHAESHPDLDQKQSPELKRSVPVPSCSDRIQPLRTGDPNSELPVSHSVPIQHSMMGERMTHKDRGNECFTTPTASPAVEENTSTPREMMHVNEVTKIEPAQDDNTFPILTANTLVGERYEIIQVIKDAKEEHVYEVVDRKGYLHCWNCSNEENAEGDEFCNDCGAELLNAPYLMHEYPISSTKDSETCVLQGAIVNTFVDHDHTYVIELPQALQSAFPNGVHLLAAGNSDAGLERRDSPNEDSTLVLLLERVHESISFPAGIFIVCDGLGGHDSGQEASRMATKIIAERIIHDLLLPPLNTEKTEDPAKLQDEEHVLGLLQRAIEEANTTICQRNQREKTDMGCTLTGSMIVGEHAYIFNVGDSRTYMLRDGKLYQLTNDHSLVGQLVAGGLIAPEDVYTHPQRSQIYRNIGDKLNVQIDVFKQQIHPGDTLLSCSDGLWEMVRDPQIADILNAAPDPQAACTQLIETANNNGGEDNVSAVVVFVR